MVQYLAIDFETTPVPFFDKKQKKKSDWSGHPRLAKVQILSFADESTSKAIAGPKAEDLPSVDIIIFHNAAFDIQAGINSEVFDESQFQL